MNQPKLNQLPEELYSGRMTEKEVINQICSFVAQNYPIYGLHKYDEDFRQDIILRLLERGSHVLHLFNPKFGDFFTFLYCYVSTLINTRLKTLGMISIREKLTFEESINTLDDKETKYHRIDFTNFEEPKAPLAQRKITPEELQSAVKDLTLRHKDKKVFILALKSSYYLTDEQIQRICKLYGFKPEYFYNMVQQCKDSLETKSIRREKAKERRNFAYYHHKRYSRILRDLEEEETMEHKYLLQRKYESRQKKHLQNWNRLNQAFEKGLLYLRPTNKTVANLMGICERQVNYYINCAKKEIEKTESENNKKSN